MSNTQYLTLLTPSLTEQKTRLEKDTFNFFLSGNMTAIEMKKYKDLVDERFSFIVNLYHESLGNSIEYYCYTNATEDHNFGFFDIFENTDSLAVECQLENPSEYPALEFIPFEWFYSDITVKINAIIQEILDQKIAEDNQAKALKEKERDIQSSLSKLHESIKNKLTPDELKSIQFYSIKDYMSQLVLVSKNRTKDASRVNAQAKSLNIILSNEYASFLKNNPDKNISFVDWTLDVFVLPK